MKGRSSGPKASVTGLRRPGAAAPSRAWTSCWMVTTAMRAAMVSLLRGASSPMRTASMSKPLVLRVRNSCSIAQRRRYRSATPKASAASATGSVVRSRQCTPSPAGGSTSRTSTRLRTTLFGRPVRTPTVGRASSTAMKRTATSASRAGRPGFAGSLSRARPSLGESVRPPEQPPAVAEAAVLGGPHQKLRRGRPEREGREDVALAIGDHRDPRRLGPDLRRPPGAVEPAPALLLGQRPRAPGRPAPGVARQEAGVHQSEDRAVVLIHRQNRVQIKAAAALRGHDRGVLDRQDRPAGAASRRPRRRLGRHLLDRHRRVAQEAGQTDLPGPARPEPPDPNAAPARLDQTSVQERPPFPGGGRQTAPAKAPSPDPPSSHDRESDIASPLKPKCVNAVDPEEGE